jgi:hypothetical protein
MQSTERSQLRDSALPPPLVAATPKQAAAAFVPVTYRTPSLPDPHALAAPAENTLSPSCSPDSDNCANSRTENDEPLASSERLNDYRIVGMIFAGTPVRVILAQHDSREPEKLVRKRSPSFSFDHVDLFA